ncbi:MAG: potassium-transporting ATPase subunit KdpB, partial [Polyangiaceae bacterium]
MAKSQENSRSMFDPNIIRPAIGDAFKKLHPRDMMKNPVMFVVEVGTALVSVLYLADLVRGQAVDSKLTIQLIVWLWFTVLFANFAEAVAEGRGKAQAATLRKMRTTTTALRTLEAGGGVPSNATGEGRGRGAVVPATDLRKGDQIYIKAGDLVPADGEIIAGVASVDESAITGESAPVVREAGGDRSALTGGTRVISDWLVVEVRQDPGGGFIDRMIALVEGAQRQKTPNEIALTILLAGLTIIFLAATMGLVPCARFFAGDISIVLLVSLLVCLIPTTIGALLSAIGIAGMDRLVQYNVIATSGRAVEAAGDIDVLMLDKTGTITYGARQAFEMVAAKGVDAKVLAEVAMLSSLADETPEGKSIVVLAEKTLGTVLASGDGVSVPFTAQTRMSGLDVGGRTLRKGASDAVVKHVTALGGTVSEDLMVEVRRIANEGGTPLVVSEGSKALGVVYLKDTVKPGMKDRFERLRAMGIKTVMITGDNPLT